MAVTGRRFVGIEALLASLATDEERAAALRRLGPNGPPSDALSTVLARHGHHISQSTIRDYRRHQRQLGATQP